MDLKRVNFSVVAIVLQVILIALFGLLGEYGATARPKSPEADQDITHMYPYFQDVHVMIFVGFGFLMTFLKRYGFTAVSVNLLLAAFAIQWAYVVRGVIHHIAHGHPKFPIHIGEMLSADFASATILISFGAVLGRTSPLQLLIMVLIEVVLAQINEYIGIDKLGAVDVGESMYIHAFGAYFGLACSRALYTKTSLETNIEGSVYHSDIFSMIGTLFLWMFWPSFNGGGADDDEQHRAVINTYLSLAACTVVVFAVSKLVHKRGKFNMVHIQNATLAGGVALGTSANMPLEPWAAMLVGSIAGVISVLGYQYVTPFLKSKFRILDTCGVNNLHGMPGILAGIVGAVAAAMASTNTWGESMYELFPLMAPMENTTEFKEIQQNFTEFHLEPGIGRSSIEQGGYQMLALTVTLLIAIVGGALTGLLLRMPCLDNVSSKRMFDDDEFFVVEGEGYPEVLRTDEIEMHDEHDTKSPMLKA